MKQFGFIFGEVCLGGKVPDDYLYYVLETEESLIQIVDTLVIMEKACEQPLILIPEVPLEPVHETWRGCREMRHSVPDVWEMRQILDCNRYPSTPIRLPRQESWRQVPEEQLIDFGRLERIMMEHHREVTAIDKQHVANGETWKCQALPKVNKPGQVMILPMGLAYRFHAGGNRRYDSPLLPWEWLFKLVDPLRPVTRPIKRRRVIVASNRGLKKVKKGGRRG